MIIQVSHKRHNVSSKHTIKYQANKVQRETKTTHTLSLEDYDLYIFLPLWQQVTKKLKICIVNQFGGTEIARVSQNPELGHTNLHVSVRPKSACAMA